MNKFQKLAYKIGRIDNNKKILSAKSAAKIGRINYVSWKKDRESWNILKCIDYKNWLKKQMW